jgi:hypothetical protein
MMKRIKNWIRKIARQVLDEERNGLIEAAAQEAENRVPDATHVAEQIDMDLLACEISYDDLAFEMDMANIAAEIDMSDLAYYCEVDADDVAERLDVSEVAEYMSHSAIAEYIEIDSSEIEIDYEEVSLHIVDHLDIEEVARHADVDRTIFTHIHLLQTQLNALIEVVRGSAMSTIDSMTFNRALDGDEE